MGRWGYRMFECDQDLDLACNLNEPIAPGKANKVELSRMIHQTDMLAPHAARAFYQTPEYIPELNATIKKIRLKLDQGLCDKLFDKYRALEGDIKPFEDPKYLVIILGALMIRAGAKIREDDLKHLRDLVIQVPSREGYNWPLNDDGFRGPGRAQFLAALDHYKPGVPRSFQDPSCFTCGKMKVDTSKSLLQCGKCKRASYCNKTCQRKHWNAHKSVCVPPEQRFMLNV